MKRTALCLVLAGLAIGCSQTPASSTADDVSQETAAHDTDFAMAEDAAELADDSTKTTKDADPRSVGDYATFAFTGSYRKAPLLLSERVVAKDADSITIDFAFTEGKAHDVWRVRTNLKSGAIHAVTRRQGENFVDASVSEFESQMGATVAVADENEALLEEAKSTIDVAGKALTVSRSVYKVRLGNKSGTLTTLTQAGFAWGDLGGELTTSDGKTIYKAKLVDLGSAASATAALETTSSHATN